MNIGKIKKNIEALVLFSEYVEEFIDWVEKNIGNKDIHYSYTDKWTVPNNSEIDEEDDRKNEKEYASFRITYFFMDNRFPCMRIFHGEDCVYSIQIQNGNLQINCEEILSKIEEN